MTQLWMQVLAAEASPMMERLRLVLASVKTSEAGDLLGRARLETRDKLRMVLTGQFSGGKSTLIEALTDGAVRPPAGADFTTDQVTEYAWSEAVTLVDTPGVRSGVRTHDELADVAVGDSDFLLFVVDIGLFDDASRDYLRYLANERRKADQMVLAITKSKKMSAPAGVREAATCEALGTMTLPFPVVEVDAHYYLRSLEGGRLAAQLRDESNLNRLRSVINDACEARGQLAQLRRPFQLIRQICDDAQALFVTDESERLALCVLASQRRIVTERRAMIETDFAASVSKFKSNCLSDIVAFVDRVVDLPDSEGGVLEAAEQALVEALERHAETFAAQVNTLTNHQFDLLAEQISEVSEGNRAASLRRLSGVVEPEVPNSVSSRSKSKRSASGSGAQPSWLRDLPGWLKQAQKFWGAGDGVKASAGSTGHQAVKSIGHMFGAKFEPWQAVKIANVIGKSAKVAGFAVSAGLSAHEVISSEREARRQQIEAERRHSAFVTEIMGHADAIASDARRQLGTIIDPPMNEFLEHIDQTRDRIIQTHEERDMRISELADIARASDRLLEMSSSPTAIDQAETTL